MFDQRVDERIRAAAFEWLADQVDRNGEVFSREVLARGLDLDGSRIPLIGPQGIFKPKVLSEVPLSITTAPDGPYDDRIDDNSVLQYKYRGTDPNHPENRGLRSAMEKQLPLIYFHGIFRGKYVATWPVYIVEDRPDILTFSVLVDEKSYPLGRHIGALGEDREEIRRYITRGTRVRLHQRQFRERVLEAYRRQCAFCRFRHQELLEAAHIVPDVDPRGVPKVSNGLALCTLHHSAFDGRFIGLRPDYVIEVRPDILSESDGPTLTGLQILNGSRITLPRNSAHYPDRELVEISYKQFRSGF